MNTSYTKKAIVAAASIASAAFLSFVPTTAFAAPLSPAATATVSKTLPTTESTDSGARFSNGKISYLSNSKWAVTGTLADIKSDGKAARVRIVTKSIYGDTESDIVDVESDGSGSSKPISEGKTESPEVLWVYVYVYNGPTFSDNDRLVGSYENPYA